MAALLRWTKNAFRRAPIPLISFPTSGFEIVKASEILDEERFEEFKKGQYYPVNIGDVYNSKYQIIGKLGFGITSTVWLARDLEFNEEIRLAERHIQFDVNALAEAVCRSVKRPISDLASISKLAEGGFNRVLLVRFKDNYTVIARIPYQSTVPKCRAVASEAATLGWLCSHGIPVPQVLGYSPTQANPVGTEYLLLEKLEGTPLSDQWFTMDNKARAKVMRQIIDIEKRFMSLSFPASGSLYYKRDLGKSDFFIPISDHPASHQIVVGPSTQLEWWYRERSLLDVDRGPWKTFQTCFEAPAERS